MPSHAVDPLSRRRDAADAAKRRSTPEAATSTPAEGEETAGRALELNYPLVGGIFVVLIGFLVAFAMGYVLGRGRGRDIVRGERGKGDDSTGKSRSAGSSSGDDARDKDATAESTLIKEPSLTPRWMPELNVSLDDTECSESVRRTGPHCDTPAARSNISFGTPAATTPGSVGTPSESIAVFHLLGAMRSYDVDDEAP